MTPPLALTGQRFSRLVVLRRGENDRFGKARWYCRCDCGKESLTHAMLLQRGQSRSCGCLRLEINSRPKKHGYSSFNRKNNHPVYGVWQHIKQRCTNPNDKFYHRYGGRGITMCAEWLNDAGAFIRYMGPRPKGHVIDRIDNDRGYEPGNVRWTTQLINNRNRPQAPKFTYNGESLTRGEWADRTGLPANTITSRLNRGWTLEQTLTVPLNTWLVNWKRDHSQPRAAIP